MLEATMTVSMNEEKDGIYHFTQWGSGLDPIADRADFDRGFVFFHGEGGMKIKMTIGIMLPETAGFAASLVSADFRFDANIGFGWELPVSPDLGVRDPTKPPEFPNGSGGNSPYVMEGLVVKLYR